MQRSIYLSIYLSIYVYIYLSIYLLISLIIYLSNYLSVYRAARLPEEDQALPPLLDVAVWVVSAGLLQWGESYRVSQNSGED